MNMLRKISLNSAISKLFGLQVQSFYPHNMCMITLSNKMPVKVLVVLLIFLQIDLLSYSDINREDKTTVGFFHTMCFPNFYRDFCR